ncbi:8926_t:CDS:1 [Ambispora gerdemannii]|uniref:8926_t:CDS:1 n=1 Tax=Ambispora gerdemannii TaxID=144530 RepID=A0A9N8V2Z4_9GLOM|nr:8926_t:CDS:1 [Ambispora gerdemannii]
MNKSIAPSKKGYVMPNVILQYPPEITPMELIQKAISKFKSSGKISRIPNSFITYRMAFCKELHLIKHPVITQPQLSALIRESWKKEPEHIRREYHQIAKEAKALFNQICIERLNENEYQDKNNTVQQFLTNDFYQDASFNQYLQSTPFSAHFLNEDYIDGIRDSFPKNALMQYSSNFRPFSFNLNPINETSISSNSFSTSIEHSNIYGVSKNSNTNNHLKQCDCGCLSCKDRIEYLENRVRELQESLENSKIFFTNNNT